MLFLTLREQVSAPVRWRRKSTKCSYISRSCHCSCKVCPGSKIVFRRSLPDSGHLFCKKKMLQKLLAASQPRLPHWKQVQLLPQAAPARHALGIYLDRVLTPQPLGPLGPMAQDLLTMTGTQDADLMLSLNPDDENARSAVVLHFPCEQIHAGVSTWFESSGQRPTYQLSTLQNRFPLLQTRTLVLETRAKCQDFVARYKDDGILYESESTFSDTSTNITVRQSKSIEDREIGRFAPLGKVLSTKLQEVFPKRDAKDTFIVPKLTSVHKSSVFWTAGTGCENWFSNLHHPDTNICLTLLHLACAILVFLMMYYDTVICQASHLAQNRSANV